MTNIAIHGAAGRMGEALLRLAAQDPDLRVVAAIERPGHPSIGKPVAVTGVSNLQPGLSFVDALPKSTSGGVFIDFSTPEGCRHAVAMSLGHKMPIVIGTTGLGDPEQKTIDDAAKTIPVLQAANMSLGVNLLLALVGQVAKKLGDNYDIEITEAHHRFKKDAPSGTAVALAKAICEATGRDYQRDAVHGRVGHDVARRPRQIGMHALRQGDTIGNHTVSYAAPGERVELTHVATNRDVFALGALHAAKWLAGKPPGRYSMSHVLGL